MRTIRFTSLLALLLTVFAAAQTTRAASGAAAGSYQFTLAGDKYLKTVEFEASAQADGSATGSIFMTDEAVITIQDVDGTGEKEGRFAGYTLKAEVDGLVVDGNRAVLSGVIRTASNESFIGQRVLLTVVDNGDNTREPDRLTWGVYQPAGKWETSDAELERDRGVGLAWEASDAEREDDAPVRMPPDTSIGTQTFTFSAYAFVDTTDGAGDIVVQP